MTQRRSPATRGRLLELVGLDGLVAQNPGRPEVTVALIDGPVGEALSQGSSCVHEAGASCRHGSLVASILVGDPARGAMGLCPGISLLITPIFADTPDGQLPRAGAAELARALRAAADAGASIIHLSLALSRAGAVEARAVTEALDHAAARGALIIAAAGNPGFAGPSALTSHPAVIVVAACDAEGRSIEAFPAGPATARRSLRAPGRDVPALSPAGQPALFGGTSAAAAFVTGAAALLWSEALRWPEGASAGAIRRALLRGARQGTGGSRRALPPLLDAAGALLILRSNRTDIEVNMQTGQTNEAPAMTGPVDNKIAAPQRGAVAQGCSCGGGEGGVPVYAIGRVEARFPSQGIEREMAQVVARSDTTGLTESQVFHAVLSRRENAYLARQMCWVLTIEGVDTYLLKPSCPAELELLVESIRATPRLTDVDVVVGQLGPIAPPWMCNGLEVPIVTFDQIWTFDVEALVASIPRPAEGDAEKFKRSAEELFLRLMQLADNTGASDEHRALNYLAVRYHAIYRATAEAHERNLTLRGVEVRPSRLSGGLRTIVDAIFTYVNRTTDVAEKQFVRVDVTEKFPFLVTKLSPFYDR